MTDTLFDLGDVVADLPAGGHEILIRVHGQPQAQGNKTGFATFRTVNGQREYSGKVAMREGKTPEARDRWKSWRGLVAEAAAEALPERFGEPWIGPVLFVATFTMARPKSHYRTGKHAGELKPGPPLWHTTKPDRSKLERSVEDSLKDAGVYKDDSQLCVGVAFKVYTLPEGWPRPSYLDITPTPGCVIRVRQL
jgi:Holliday junction resolvase RusA-like endonuclease